MEDLPRIEQASAVRAFMHDVEPMHWQNVKIHMMYSMPSLLIHGETGEITPQGDGLTDSARETIALIRESVSAIAAHYGIDLNKPPHEGQNRWKIPQTTTETCGFARSRSSNEHRKTL